VHFCASAFFWLVCPFRHRYELPRQATGVLERLWWAR
jgi:hypothetical protein